MIHIAIIGDIHNDFDALDVAFFNESDYDLMLITGDLADFRSEDALEVANLLAQLEKPALLIGGNHDCISTLQFIAEIKGIEWLSQRDGTGQERRVEELRSHLGQVILGEYSAHEFSLRGMTLAVIAARPFSPGGGRDSPAALSAAPLRRRMSMLRACHASSAAGRTRITIMCPLQLTKTLSR